VVVEVDSLQSVLNLWLTTIEASPIAPSLRVMDAKNVAV
jgi:hypothetical protein